MSWKDEYQLLDVDNEPDRTFVFECKKCRNSKRISVGMLLKKFDKRTFMSEVETGTKCHDTRCNGPTRIVRENSDLLEPFQGGLP